MLAKLTLAKYLTKVSKKEINPKDVATEINDAIDRLNPNLNIYLAREKKIVESVKTPLMGAPIAVKDNFLTKGMTTTASSKVLENFSPVIDATVITRLKAKGAYIIGKTNMDAWAHGSSTETSDFSATKNPRNPEYLPGGSSGGSAAAVASNLCLAAIGSETAGSIRQPSSWCGCVGLKPTYGRVSRYGVVAMGSSLDCPGPIGKTVEDTAILLNIIAGKDPLDGSSSPSPVPDFTKSLQNGVKGKKIGLTYIDHQKLVGTQVAKAMEQVAKVLTEAGASVTSIPLSDTLEEGKILNPDMAIAVYTVVQRSEVSSNLARFDGVRFGQNRSFFGDEAKRRIMLGTFTLSKGYSQKLYVKAQKVRTMYIQNYAQLFSKYDLLISPSSPGYAQKLGASKSSPMFGELEDMLIEPSSISGLPGINVPMHHDPVTNLYLGLNIVAPMWREAEMLACAASYERLAGINEWLD